ncbi:MAG: hypothetical protein QNK20_04030, partial [Aureibaculum sp.]|nr:hypothetical protein [Aureibaculum sp.]
MQKIKYLIICVAISLFSTNAISQRHEVKPSEHHGEKSQDDGHSDETRDFHKHHIALFGGMTTNFKHHDNLLTVGLDYEYRLPFGHNKFGIGFGAEYLKGDSTEILFELLLIYHPVGGLKFVTAPMFVIVEEHSEGGDGTHEAVETTTKNEFGFRFGTAYDFHINDFTISPTVNFDIIGKSPAIAYGITFGIG